MATRHTYATADDLRDWLSGTNYASGWTSDAGPIRRVLEAQSRRIDSYCRGGSFGPKSETRHYDIGLGNLRHSPQYSIYNTVEGNIGTAETLVGIIPLDGWLSSATTVTAYDATDRGSSETLTAGYNADYWLMPYNFNPKTILEMNEDTAKSLGVGQQTLSILGEWGYTSDTQSETTCDLISSTTTTSISVDSATSLSPAQTILINTEQIYITSISGNTLTVERAVNGTAADTHSAATTVSSYDYPELVVQACQDMARLVYRDRDAGRVDVIGTGEAETTRNRQEIHSILRSLDEYRVASTSNGLIF
jgi:hypothetical protein